MSTNTEGHWSAVRTERPRARQPWRCYVCSRVIAVGEAHRKISGLRDGGWLCLRTCEGCTAGEAA